jgi:hypothetical protein
MRQPKPGWKKTNVSWEIKKVIWLRWALGDTEIETIHYLDGHRDEYPNAPVHRDTIRKVREEFLALPSEWLDKLISDLPEIEHFVKEKRPDYLKKGTGEFRQHSPHFTELSITALMLAENLSRYRNESATFLGFPNKVGNAIYGEPSAAAQLARLQEVDKPTALNLLSHLREEFSEVDDITDWANLTDDKITENLIKRLTLKGSRGDFKGNCSGCLH